MTETPADGTHNDAEGWETVAHHDFGGTAELDATITAALGEHRPTRPLYEAVDAESAERFLASAGSTDARVRFRIEGNTVRVSADGRVELCRSGEPITSQ
jgi:hypothetical protein